MKVTKLREHRQATTEDYFSAESNYDMHESSTDK